MLPWRSVERGQLLQTPHPVLAQPCSGSGVEGWLAAGTLLGIYSDWAPTPASVKSLKLGAEGVALGSQCLRTTYKAGTKTLAPNPPADLELDVGGY